MALEIVGAGFGRTGTLSLKYALEKIGFGPCYHMAELQAHPEHVSMWAQAHRGEPVDWDVLFEDYRATVDWPSCNLWKEQAEYYPDAKVILSTRDPERWYESVHNTIYASTVMARESDDPGIRARGEWAFEIIWDKIFHGRMDDKAHVIDVFRAHEERVKATIEAGRLLVFEAASGWPPLCEFLGVDVPEDPYPRVNTTDDFRERIKTGQKFDKGLVDKS
jgi:hypothetical protein